MYKHIKEVNKEFYDLALLLSEKEIKEVFVDIESTGLDNKSDKILCIQIMAGEEIFIFDFIHLNNEALHYVVNLLKLTGVKCVFHNTKFDIKFLYHNTGIMLNNVFDTMNCEVLINAGVGKALYSLKDLAFKYADIVLEKSERENFYTEKIEEFSKQMLDYAALDVKVLKPIYEKQLELIKQSKEEKVLEIEMNLLPVVAKMEYDGILLNTDAWLALEKNEIVRLEQSRIRIVKGIFDGLIQNNNFSNALELADTLRIPVKTKRDRTALESISDVTLAFDWAKEHINLDSYIQVPVALNLLGIPVKSANKKELENYKNHDIVKDLLEFSESGKRVSTYGSNFLELINPVSGRIHTDFLNMGAATGRFSSSNPNLQNIPRSKDYRNCFISSPDYRFITADYSQQEYRGAGAVSNEQRIVDAYLSGADMHTSTAAIVFNVKMEDVTKDQRNIGKTINFAILYGSSEFGLKRNLGISIDRAKEIINAFNKGYPTLYAFKTAAENAILDLGYSITPLGRRRYSIPKPTYMTNSEYMQWIGRVKREGFNHIIQGCGADTIKIAMINIYNNNPFGEKLRLLLQVHDELDAEAHESILMDAVEFIKEEMLKAEQLFLGAIPAKVDISYDTTYWAK